MNTTPPADTLQAIAAEMRDRALGSGLGGEIARWTNRIEALAASAPPADALHEALRGLLYLWRTSEKNGERVTQFDKGYEQASDECADALETALNSIAASAQLREAEPAAPRTPEQIAATLAWLDSLMDKPAAEPAPVAQGDGSHALAELRDLTACQCDPADKARGSISPCCNHLYREDVIAVAGLIADHARRDAELQAIARKNRDGFEEYERRYYLEVNAREALEASLAACRADAADWRTNFVHAVAMRLMDNGLMHDAAHEAAEQDARAIDAALRQEAT